MGYAEGVSSVPTKQYTDLITHEAGDVHGLAPSMINSITNYIQTSVTPNTDTYLAIGSLLVVVGVIFVAIGDRKLRAGAVKP